MKAVVNLFKWLFAPPPNVLRCPECGNVDADLFIPEDETKTEWFYICQVCDGSIWYKEGTK